MQKLKDLLAITIIASIAGVVITLSFMFAVVMIPVMITGIIYCYIKDERCGKC